MRRPYGALDLHQAEQGLSNTSARIDRTIGHTIVQGEVGAGKTVLWEKVLRRTTPTGSVQ
ncbi:hypothetical protein CFB47_39535 [Burkholderia sp. AU27893]|nr:hypothetical protein [Burkholderia contaminans]MBA9867535.1 hypothetical protein [Burkholderia contaminans]MBA9934380.1 hypothetical protein [Burkholderia contaminans]MCB4331763.1 hypothetical protein [Burkholderia contaminans]OXI51601.1 hypothetical protein CFB47_39535 [Burkholderia sp. AU27893]